MDTAILFTGQLRTIQRTAKLLKQNLIDTNKADIFGFCEASIKDEQYGSQEEGSLAKVREVWGDSIKSLVVAEEDESYYKSGHGKRAIRDKYRRERSKQLSEAGKLWYENTGSALEYYQLRRAYEDMCLEEEARGKKYDLVGRCRFDIALFKPMKFENYYDPNIFWGLIREGKKSARKSGASTATIFYAALLAGGNRSIFDEVVSGHLVDVGYSGTITPDNFGDCLKANSGDVGYGQYLKILKGIDIGEPCGEEETRKFLESIPGVHSLRYNVVYFTRREEFEKIIELADCVGEYDSGGDSDWCSENQFGFHLVYRQLLSLNYHSGTDEDYLINLELGASTLNKDNEVELFVPDSLTWTCIRINLRQMESDYADSLTRIDTNQSAVEVIT